MKRKPVHLMILSLFVVGLIACGDSDDEAATDQQTPTSTTQIPQTQEPATGELPPGLVVDFAAEEAIIQELIASHAKAYQKQAVNDIMLHWLKSETAEVFIVDSFGGKACTEKWSGVRKLFEGRFVDARVGALRAPETIEELGIDARGQNATIAGKLDNGTTPYRAAVKKNAKGKWKIRAVEFIIFHKFAHCEIKLIETPR